MEPHEASMFIRRKRHVLLRSGDKEEVLLFMSLWVNPGCSQLLCRIRLGLGPQGGRSCGSCLSYLQLVGLGNVEPDSLQGWKRHATNRTVEWAIASRTVDRYKVCAGQ